MIPYKPRILDEIFSIIVKWPADIQGKALKAIQDERDRLKRGDYTPEERRLFVDFPKQMGRTAGEFRDKIIIEALSANKNPKK